MKTHQLSARGILCLVFLFAISFGKNLQAQGDSPTLYMEITKVKDANDDLMAMHDELVKPFIQERIKQGNQVVHAMFRVFSPYSDHEAYDYVMLDMYNDFNHLNLGDQKMGEIAYTVFPNADIPKMVERYNDAIDIASNEVFVVRDEAFPGPEGGDGMMPKYVQVNHMKVSEANSGAYAQMESSMFKPIHQERAKKGHLHDWIMAQRIMPYGSEWDNNFLTFDIYSEWGDMADGGDFAEIFKKVHPEKKLDEAWDKMSYLRDLRRAEIWKLISVVDSPSPDVTYKTVKEGTGPNPMKGQEVAWRGKLLNTEGDKLFATSDLGFDFYTTVGKNHYDRYFDKGLMQMKKGGIMTIELPPEAQDKTTRGMSGGQTVVMKIELVDIGMPSPSGADLLMKKIEGHGLSAAKEKYKKLQTDNPNGYVFREGDMNALGYELMGKGHHDAAIYVFKLNHKNNPKSWNACDSLADGYRAAGNYPEAKNCYKKAIEINPDFQAAKDKLAKL